MKYKLLDLFCKAGGAAKGYMDAGFEVIGVDKDPQPNYPGKFIQAPAIWYLKRHLHDFDAYHASPPCQFYSNSTAQFRLKGKFYPDMIEKTRYLLLKTGKPSVIENVPTAPIRPDIKLVGYMFALPLIKKRHFELNNWFCFQPGIPPKIGSVSKGDFAQVVGKGQKRGYSKTDIPCKLPGTIKEQWSFAMGINWMTEYKELSEAIPPAYTRYIGKNLIEWIRKL